MSAVTCWVATAGAGGSECALPAPSRLTARWSGRVGRSPGIPSGGHPGPVYDAEQLEAEQAQRGLWSRSFGPPWA